LFTRQQQMDSLEQSFRLVFRQFKQEINQVLGKKMNSGEFFLLRYLFTQGPQKISALSTIFGVSNSHITQLSNRLVQKGWVIRSRSQADKRVVELRITHEGRKIVEELEQKRLAYFREKFDSFTTEEITVLLRLFQKIIDQPTGERGNDCGAS
jgi:DNA-binding MarR family transcriptional regulator